MSDQDPTTRDVWRLLGNVNRRLNEMNRRFGERFDVIERQLVTLDARVGGLDASITARLGALKESIEARDFRLDEHGRRITDLEESLP